MQVNFRDNAKMQLTRERSIHNMNPNDVIRAYNEDIMCIDHRCNLREDENFILKTPIHSIKSYMNNSNYESISNEYYNNNHITSRNLDAVTLDFCRKFDFPIPSYGFVLELGAGNGCTGKYCKIESNRIIQIDISKAMLLLNPREDCFQKVPCDAFRLPILSSELSAVTAFLYDPYNKLELYKEVCRVLHDGGVFIGTLPHFKFCMPLRRIIGYNKNKTKFLTKDEYLVELDSFLMNDSEIRQIVKRAGFTSLQMYDLYLPPDVQEVSEHILIAASALKVNIYNLPIVKLIIAKK